MSSVLKSYSQIPVRVKYLIPVADYDGSKVGVGANGTSAFYADAGAYLSLGSIALADDVVAATGYTVMTLDAGELYKDMGRQITIVDTDGAGAKHLAVYRQVQYMGGVASEGVEDAAPSYYAHIFLRVWAADGKNVVVARTG